MAKRQFKSESKRLLDLMINSIYTNKDIFLREIISNASDAIDKLCFKSLTDENVGLSREDFKITIEIDKENSTITVSDNGIGMDKDDLEHNLGTIASSGSLKFKEELQNKDKEDIDIIGQFGVGFYSAFMVSKNIKVLTKKYGDDNAYIWESSGADGYTIKEAQKDSAGTVITMTLKEDTEEVSYSDYLDQYKIQSLIKKYSDYIRYPILMEMEKSRPVENSDEKKEGEDSAPKYETYYETETLNSMVPIWHKNKKDVKDEEYNEFYSEHFMDYNPPAKVIRTSVEGVVTYKALLFIPSKTPFNYFTKEYKKGLQLYSSGVMIMENCEELLPEHFRFVKGIVETDDISLNISREMLQQDRKVATIANALEKKIKNELKSMMDKEREDYEKFFENFGIQLKYGIVSNYGMEKDKLQDLLLFHSSKEGKLVSLEEYSVNLTEENKYIYYATGESIASIENQPQLEGAKEAGIDILYLTEDVDEFCIKTLMNYKGKNFRDAVNEGIEESENTPEETEEEKKENEETLSFVKDTLGDKVSSVVVSKKLKTAPACLTAKGQITFEMEKYYASQNMSVKAERVLELNLENEIVKKMISLKEDNKDFSEKIAKVLYYQSELLAGLDISDKQEYTKLVLDLIK
ncbi:MAG: molecular chaperone HtpG [Acutalibacteraceae bacterium]